MFKKTFFNGLKVFVPLVLTVAIVVWIFYSLETFFGRFMLYFIPNKYYFDGLGILIGILFIFLIGILVNAWLIRWIHGLVERVFKNIPGVKTIYNAIQDFMSYLDSSGKDTQQQPVLIDTMLGKTIGFITQTKENLPEPLSEHKGVLVYIPLSYQIGGLMVLVDERYVEPMDWTVNEAMSYVLTAGMTSKPKGFKSNPSQRQKGS